MVKILDKHFEEPDMDGHDVYGQLQAVQVLVKQSWLICVNM